MQLSCSSQGPRSDAGTPHQLNMRSLKGPQNRSERTRVSREWDTVRNLERDSPVERTQPSPTVPQISLYSLISVLNLRLLSDGKAVILLSERFSRNLTHSIFILHSKTLNRIFLRLYTAPNDIIPRIQPQRFNPHTSAAVR